MSEKSKQAERLQLNLQLDPKEVSDLLEQGRRLRLEVERGIRSMQSVTDEQLRAKVR